ncbi:4a-hydroxytetrahydrobiopterin dehydratase [Candidatus Woesearchaeota archaeon]|nr:4a-hydroxytetrahydrobiopterin dehydratase [Candidatus Woesearchaeota archaeon]
MDLLNKKCVPCEGGIPPLEESEAAALLENLKGWKIEDNRVTKTFDFKDFMDAIDFVNKIAEVAELEQHHPDINIHYAQVIIELWTHAINGLSENDFILAAKIDALL